MPVELIGYRFSPTEEELVNDYLKNKNLGKTWLVDHAINEINLCSFHPEDLPALSKIQSNDLVWYFFSPIVYANEKKTLIKRTAGNGFWKVTAPDSIIEDKRGSKIGIKKTIVYHEGKGANGVRTPWLIHEYHITYLPPNKTTYVLCQLKLKRTHKDIAHGGNDSVVSQLDTVREINTVSEAVQVDQPVQNVLTLYDFSPLNVQEDLHPLDESNPTKLQETPEVQILEMPENEKDDHLPSDASDLNTFFNLPPQTPYDDYYWNDFIVNDRWNMEDVTLDEVMREDRNVYMPMKALYKGDHIESSYDGSSSVVSQSNTVREINRTVPEVEVDQPDEDGFSLNELSIPLNVQKDLPVDAINPNLLQQIPEVQIEQPHEDGMFLEELEGLVNEQEDLRPMDSIDPNIYFNDDNPKLLQQTPYNNDGWINNLLAFNGGNFDVICDQVIMQENRNVYIPRKALSGIIVDSGSDSDDSESIYSTSYQGTSSPHDSVGGSFKDFPCFSCTDSYNDPQTFEYLSVSRMSREDQPTRRNVPSKEEVKRATTMEKTEKKGWFILEEAMETNHKPWYVYLMNMITSFIILMGFVANIRL